METGWTVFVIGIGVSLFVAAVMLYRTRKLSFRYLVGWVGLSVTVVIAGVLARFVSKSAEQTMLVGAIVVVLVVLVQLSISVSGLQRQVHDLTEAVALAHATSELDTPTEP